MNETPGLEVTADILDKKDAVNVTILRKIWTAEFYALLDEQYGDMFICCFLATTRMKLHETPEHLCGLESVTIDMEVNSKRVKHLRKTI